MAEKQYVTSKAPALNNTSSQFVRYKVMNPLGINS